MINIWGCGRLPVLAGLLVVSCLVTFEDTRGAAPRPDRLAGLSGPGKTPALARLSTGSGFKPEVVASFGRLPLAFEPNVGQTDARVRFLARGGGMTAFFSDTETAMVLSRAERRDPKALPRERREPAKVEQAVVRMKLAGAGQPRRVIGLEKLPGMSNYFIGNDPAKWRTDVPHYARIQYEGVYPGIDLVWYGNQRQLEYDFVVAPGADPKQIQVAYEGVESLEVEAGGDLVLRTALGEVRQQQPRVYQEIGGTRVEVGARYAIVARNRVSFQLAKYERKRELRIDPVVLVYSTYLGGSGDDYASGIAVDAAGSAYVTGYTKSTNFPTQSPYQATYQGADSYATDVFVTKLNAAGTALLYSTYLGGTQSQSASGIAVDGNGAAYVAGYTTSADFPHTPGAFQTGGPPLSSTNVGFVSKLNATGSALSYSTFIGSGSGNNETYAYAIAVDAAGFAYVTGKTGDWGLPTSVTAVQRQVKGGSDAFVIKLNVTGTGEVYGTLLGGSQDDGANGIAVDSSGNAFLAGVSASSDFPMQNPIQASNPVAGQWCCGSGSGFVAKLNADASKLSYSTYLGGAGLTYANAIAVDGSGNAYVTGQTNAPSSGPDTFPLQNALQPTRGAGGSDAFLTKINGAGTALVYSTYVGGSGDDSGLGVGVDAAGNAYVSGKTTSYDFPVVNAFQSNRGGFDQIVLKSVDAGTTWNAGSAGEATGAVNTLAVNPVTPSTLYAGTATGRVFQSIDGGAHWSRSDTGLPGAPVLSLAIAASNTATLFAGTTAGVFKSTNGGSSWFAQNSGLTNTTVNAVAVDPSNSNIVYAATGSGASGAIFKSANGGGTWAATVTGTGSYFTSLVIHPAKPQYVYSGTANGYIIYTFNAFATAAQRYNPNDDITSVNALAIDPAAEMLYAAVDTHNYWLNGIYYSSQIVLMRRTTDLQCVNGLCDVFHPYGDGPGLSVAVSSSGRVYVGRTSTLDGVANTGGFVGPFRVIATDPFAGDTLYIGNNGAASDAFLTVVNSAGTALVSSSYFGGSRPDEGRALAVDTSGNAWLAGVTSSPDLPATPGAKQAANAGGADAFVAKFHFAPGPPPVPVLSISKTHVGNFSQGQNGQNGWTNHYYVEVRNAGSADTSGTVTVTETVPSGLTLVSMAGTGWTCPNGGTACTRSDALNGGATYPAITVTVNVASNAPSQVTNQVSAAGGSSATASASDLTTILPLGATLLSDFNRDGTADIIWQDPVSGLAQVWLLGGAQGTSIIGAANLTASNPWHIVGVGDFNGDGRPDVVWQDPVTGAAQVWFLGGAQGNVVTGAITLNGGNAWRIMSIADFNGDGHPDLFWQDPVTGLAQIWLMGGAQGITLLSAVNLTASNPWKIVGTGDFNGDGRPDVLWQDPVSGAVQVWYLGGALGNVVTSATNLTASNTWRIVSIGDFNGDGHPDVVWQDPVSGASQVWFLGGTQGTTITGSAALSGPNAWRIAGPR
jgi:uncharacterized repeat protein (TIGR01451 family)